MSSAENASSTPVSNASKIESLHRDLLCHALGLNNDDSPVDILRIVATRVRDQLSRVYEDIGVDQAELAQEVFVATSQLDAAIALAAEVKS